MRSFGDLTDTELQVAVDGMRLMLLRAWQRGEPGSLMVLYDLARASAEGNTRGNPLRPLRDPRQMTCFDPDEHQLGEISTQQTG